MAEQENEESGGLTLTLEGLPDDADRITYIRALVTFLVVAVYDHAVEEGRKIGISFKTREDILKLKEACHSLYMAVGEDMIQQLANAVEKFAKDNGIEMESVEVKEKKDKAKQSAKKKEEWSK